MYRTAPTTVEVLAPSPAGMLTNLLAWGAVVLAGALALAGGAVWYWRRSRRVTASQHPPTRRRQPEGGLRGPTRGRNQRNDVPTVRIMIAEGAPPRVVSLHQRECWIGRDPGSDISLSNDEVSWKHAVLWIVQGGVLRLADLQSTNGTFVGPGRTPVSHSSPVMLRAGDTFWIGPVRLVVEAVD
ncbi:MAG: FHA domain-containing protein [Roseiflexaceae bacterium]|nr:FHA domain-containing protein [Roseiflexaceae bacterium]